MSLVGKLVKVHKWPATNLVRAARALGLPTPGETLVFGDETDIAAFTDYELREFRVDGRGWIDSCDPLRLDLTPLENAAFRAWLHSRTSLFRTAGVLPDSNQIRLCDLLEPERPEALLTDINLCGSLQRLGPDLLLFLRLLEIDRITMSSGFFFGFHPRHTERLLQSFGQKMKKVPPEERDARKFAFFYEKYRDLGEAQ